MPVILDDFPDRYDQLKEQHHGFNIILRSSKTYLYRKKNQQESFYFGKQLSTNDKNPLGSENG